MMKAKTWFVRAVCFIFMVSVISVVQAQDEQQGQRVQDVVGSWNAEATGPFASQVKTFIKEVTAGELEDDIKALFSAIVTGIVQDDDPTAQSLKLAAEIVLKTVPEAQKNETAKWLSFAAVAAANGIEDIDANTVADAVAEGAIRGAGTGVIQHLTTGMSEAGMSEVAASQITKAAAPPPADEVPARQPSPR